MNVPSWLRVIASAITTLLVFLLLGSEREAKADQILASTKPGKRVRRRMRRHQNVLERRFDRRLLGGQVVPPQVIDYLHETKTAMAAGEYGEAAWNQRYVRAWLDHHP